MKSDKGGKERWRIVSWVACAKGKVTKKCNPANQLTQAMRYAIRIQIKNWKNNPQNAHYLQKKCKLCNCGDLLKLEVDHYPLTFSEIRDNFINGNELECSGLTFRWDNKQTSFRFQRGESLSPKWQRYHMKHASFRWLCGDSNKRMNGKKFKMENAQ